MQKLFDFWEVAKHHEYDGNFVRQKVHIFAAKEYARNPCRSSAEVEYWDNGEVKCLFCTCDALLPRVIICQDHACSCAVSVFLVLFHFSNFNFNPCNSQLSDPPASNFQDRWFCVESKSDDAIRSKLFCSFTGDSRRCFAEFVYHAAFVRFLSQTARSEVQVGPALFIRTCKVQIPALFEVLYSSPISTMLICLLDPKFGQFERIFFFE